MADVQSPIEVEFRFLTEDEQYHLRGTALHRDGQMVLACPGDEEIEEDPFCIVGRPEGRSDHRWFAGRGDGIDARWAEIDGIYVGLWIQDDTEYLFSVVAR